MKVYEIGSVHPCLVTNWGGVHEATAKRCIDVQNNPFWLVYLPSSRGKGGKEAYMVTGIEHEENEGFVLV